MEEKKSKGGRKPLPIDEKLLENLTKLHLSDQVIAHCVGCHVDTLHNRFSDKMEEWRSQSRGKIAHILFDEALTTRQPWAIKMIAQRHLGYSDRYEFKDEEKIVSSPTELAAKLEVLKDFINKK